MKQPDERDIRQPHTNIVRILGQPASQRIYWDHELPGFGLRVRASGRKYYVAQVRANGRRHRLTIGSQALAPDTARKEAIAFISEARNGDGVVREREGSLKEATIAELGKRFLYEHVETHCKPSTGREYSRLVKSFVIPNLGKRRVSEIRPSDIAALHRKMRETRY